MERNIEDLKKFLYYDMRIKNEMVMMGSVTEADLSTDEGIMNYTDKVDNSLKYIFECLKRMLLSIGLGDLFLEKLEELKESTFKKFYDCKFDIDKLKSFYQYSITEMDEKFVDLVRESCVGYSFSFPPVDKVNSINEMLHVTHSYVINNENILQSFNVVETKPINDYTNITLYGNNSDFAKNIFTNFPIDIDCGDVDIVSVTNNKIIVMIRDRGHALTMEIDKIDNEVECHYFIPKLCNIDMINRLPGVRKVKDDAPTHSGTNGVFYSMSDSFVGDLYKFVEMVPTDSDMEIKRDFHSR